MSYRQYTRCTSPTNYIGAPAAQAIIGAALAALLLVFGAAIVPGVLLVALGALIAFCRWWLYDRLICLDGDVCAAGMLLTVEPPTGKSGLERFDTDYSINLVFPPHLVGATQADVENDGFEGNLIKEQPAIAARNLDWQGYTSRQWANYPSTAVLHGEFEGAGIYDLLQTCLAALPVAAAAAVVCTIPIFGWIACLILLLIAAIIVVAGIVVALNDTANPSDVDANLGELHVNDPTGRGADILVVKGTWVYDSFHEGWNEIHPIKHCQRIGTWDGSWSFVGDVNAWVKGWCDAIASATADLTVNNQGKPENQWTIHPVIDGCRPDDNKPPVIK